MEADRWLDIHGVTMNGTAGMILVLLALLAASAGISWWAWNELGTVELSFHGKIALSACVGGSLLVGIGLMWLVYYSHKNGFDDEAGKD